MIQGFSDSSVISYGDTIDEAFVNATIEILSVMGKLGKTSDGSKFEFQLKAGTVEELFLEWMTAVAEKCDAENIIPCKAEIRIGSFKNDYFLHGHIHGRKVKADINNVASLKALSKAVVEVDDQGSRFTIRFSG